MTQLEKTDIIWNATYKAFYGDMLARRARVSKSLASLKNQTGLYADEHRRVLAMYDEVIQVVERHRHSPTDGEIARNEETKP